MLYNGCIRIKTKLCTALNITQLFVAGELEDIASLK
jgi:hypothetical protein